MKESKLVGERLKLMTSDEDVEKLNDTAFASVGIGAIRDDPDDDYGTVNNVMLGMELEAEARRLGKSTLWALDSDAETVYFFIGDEDEVLEKLK
jgi:hypothetical protein